MAKEIDRSHDHDTEEFYSVNFKNYKVNGDVVTVPDELGEAIEHSWPVYAERKVPEEIVYEDAENLEV